jgi:VIT1/CCC1 family predicted Fe2+/Mn2+ transporter
MAYADRKINVLANVNTALALSTSVQALTSQMTSQSKQVADLQGQIQAAKAQQADIQIAIETYEKDFIDRKNAAPTSYPRLKTLQDAVLAFFFAAYAASALLCLFIVFRTTAPMQKMTAVGVSTVGFFILGLLLAECIRRYA